MQSTADNPRIRVCRQPDIKRKFPDSRRITAPDANGNSVGVGDIVTLKEGRLAGKPGTVKYVVRGSVFLQCRSGCLPETLTVIGIDKSLHACQSSGMGLLLCLQACGMLAGIRGCTAALCA